MVWISDLMWVKQFLGGYFNVKNTKHFMKMDKIRKREKSAKTVTSRLP